MTPARPAPNAPQINCTVLIAAAAHRSFGRVVDRAHAHADRCGHAIPIPIADTNSATTQTARTSHVMSSPSRTAAKRQPDRHHQRRDGHDAHDHARRSTDALTISLTVQPTARATPKNPAVTGAR